MTDTPICEFESQSSQSISIISMMMIEAQMSLVEALFLKIQVYSLKVTQTASSCYWLFFYCGGAI